MIEALSLRYEFIVPVPEYNYMIRPINALDLLESEGHDEADMDVPGKMMFKVAGGATESAADGLASTEWSAQKPPSRVKEVSRVRQEFPEAWIWTETHTK